MLPLPVSTTIGMMGSVHILTAALMEPRSLSKYEMTMAKSHGIFVPSMLSALLHNGVMRLCGYKGPASKGTIPSGFPHSHLHACIQETAASISGA